MNLAHFSKTKFPLSKTRKYKQADNHTRFNFKPTGLWVSDESESMSWSRWCRDNHFQEQNLKYKTELDIDLSKVLLINSARDIQLFQLAYRQPLALSAFMSVDWAKVAKAYKGIVITPYLWDFRLKFDYIWYYGWDCAGGCIWDLTCIKLATTTKVR